MCASGGFSAAVIAILAGLWTAAGFNVDSRHPLIYSQFSQGQRQSYFGYSVALSVDRSSRAEPRNWLLVAAPRANSTFPTHAGLSEPGVFYKCSLAAPEGRDTCREVVLDPTGSSNAGQGDLIYRDLKDSAWLGGALDVQPIDDGRVVVCSPRWKNQRYPGHYLMNGACYWMTVDMVEEDADKLLPLISRRNQGKTFNNDDIFYYAFGEAGISAHFPETPQNGTPEMLIGAPGVLDWTGTVVLYRDGRDFISEASSRRRRRASRTSMLTAFEDVFVPQPQWTAEIQMFDLFGYAVSSGKFSDEDKTKIFYVAGAPRAASYKGKAVVFLLRRSEDAPLVVRHQFEGEQMGEYFGAALCSTDLTGDGLDELLVGAPQYTLPSSEGQHAGDEGRVYVFTNEGNWRFTEVADRNKRHMLVGSGRLGSRFGTAIARLGDINQDGYDDVAIGAPYETVGDAAETGSGAVYIYLGSPAGIIPQYSQRIGTTKHMPLRGFGISISRGTDIDGNLHPDIGVGAHESGVAVVLRSRPVVSFQVSLNPEPERLSDDADRFTLNACIKYSGVSTPDTLGVDIRLQLDILYRPARVYMERLGEKVSSLDYQETLSTARDTCRDFIVYLKKAALDRSRPIKVQLGYKLQGADPSSGEAGPEDSLETGAQATWITPGGPVEEDRFCKVCPVLSPNEAGYATALVAFASDCGSDNICYADLKVAGQIKGYGQSNPYPIGKTRTLTLDASVANSGEPAYLPKIEVSVPSPVSLIRLPQSCQEVSRDTSSHDLTVVCDLPGPLLHNAAVSAELVLDVSQVQGGRQQLDFGLFTYSSSEELLADRPDNSLQLTLPLRTEADMTITGRSDREQYLYSSSGAADLQQGMKLTVLHHYQVTNYGPSLVNSVDLEFFLPERVLSPDGNALKFLHLYAPEAYLNQRLTCYRRDGNFFTGELLGQQSDESGDVDILFEGDEEDDIIEARRKRSVSRPVQTGRPLRPDPSQEKDILASLSVQPNRTLALHCSLSHVQCVTVWCKHVGPFSSGEDTATVTFRSVVDVSKLETLMQEKDVVVFVSTGWVKMIKPGTDVQPTHHRPDRAEAVSKIVGSLPGKTVSTWVIVLAALAGVLLLLLISVGLFKLGFFKRQKYEELQQQQGTIAKQDEPADSSAPDAEMSGGRQ